MRVVKRGKDYWLELQLPFTERGEIHLFRKGDELIIRVGTIKRHLVLPHILAKQEPKGAKLEDGILQIRFGVS